jgi:hypothetical protein
MVEVAVVVLPRWKQNAAVAAAAAVAVPALP